MKFSFRNLLVFTAFILTSYYAVAQSSSYNQWLDHLPYNNCKAVAEAGNLIYAATPYSLLYYNKADNSINRLNKVTPNGLSDIGISSIAYSTALNTLVVAYANTNIDLIKGSQIINIPDIKRKQILGNKTINSILIIDKLAYLSCGFGIVVLDLEKEEIKDTYYIGPSGTQIDVKSIAFHENDSKFYAATEKGVYSALSTSNLAFYVNWSKESSISGADGIFNMITSFSGKIYTNKAKPGAWAKDTMFVYDGNNWMYFHPQNTETRFSMRVSGDKLIVTNHSSIDFFNSDGTNGERIMNYNPGSMRTNDAMIDKDNMLWVADLEKGLWKVGPDKIGVNYALNGPVSPLVATMDASGKQLWAVPGGRDAIFQGLSNEARFYTYFENAWKSYDINNVPELSDFRDILSIAADPNDADHVFLGSWGHGLIEFDNGELKEIYNTSNSSLQYFSGYDGILRVGGLAFDSFNNLWATNDGAPNILSVRKANGEWKSFNLGTQGTAIDVGILVIDKENQKWIQQRDLALFVFNDNGTPDNPSDDQKQKLTSSPGKGNLPGTGISSLAVDRNGQLWIGTNQGVAVIYSPENVFTGESYDAERVRVVEGDFFHYLLETENITAIAVNGNNEKWLGTDKSGVFLMSDDGSEELLHFTEANSPLLSNSIQSIKITSNGEVFFGTSLGIVSYKDYKVESPASLDSLLVYPNPVRPEYNGPIYISNLVSESNVKITDVTGALVWEVEAQGGQVIWDGNNLEGRRVNTGVYLIFVTNPDGTQKKASKVLFIR